MHYIEKLKEILLNKKQLTTSNFLDKTLLHIGGVKFEYEKLDNSDLPRIKKKKKEKTTFYFILKYCEARIKKNID